MLTADTQATLSPPEPTYTLAPTHPTLAHSLMHSEQGTRKHTHPLHKQPDQVGNASCVANSVRSKLLPPKPCRGHYVLISSTAKPQKTVAHEQDSRRTAACAAATVSSSTQACSAAVVSQSTVQGYSPHAASVQPPFRRGSRLPPGCT